MQGTRSTASFRWATAPPPASSIRRSRRSSSTRLRSRFRETQSFAGFSDHEILELLLTYGSPRKDTKQLAKNLLATFGNLKCVFEAKPEQLMQAEGVGEAQATLISMMLPLPGCGKTDDVSTPLGEAYNSVNKSKRKI